MACMQDCHTGNSNGRCLFCITPGSMSCCAIPHLDNARTAVCQDWSGKSSAFCMQLLVCSDLTTWSCYKTTSAPHFVHIEPCRCSNCNYCCLRPLYASGHLATANGAVALLDNFPSMDSTEVAQAKAYGAIILAHGNMAEWAFTNAISIGSGWCQMPLFCITDPVPPPPFLLFSYALSSLLHLLLHSAKAVYQVFQQHVGHLF